MEKKASTFSKDSPLGIAERVVYGIAMAVLMKAVQAGWITADMAPYVAGGVVTAVGGFWAWWINRPIALAQAAAALSPDTKVVTTAEIAGATPEINIVSADAMKVTPRS